MLRGFIILVLLLQGCSSSVTFGIGGAFVETVPSELITGHEQFHLSLEHEYIIDESISIETGWHHFSNGSKLGIGNKPNHGLDFFGSQLKFRLF